MLIVDNPPDGAVKSAAVLPGSTPSDAAILPGEFYGKDSK